MKNALAVLVALLGLAVSAAEQKHSWFDLDVGDIGSTRSWPKDGSNYEAYLCVVTNTASGEFSANPNRILFDAEDPMTVLPVAKAPITDISYALVSATMKMVPFAESDIPDIPENAKTAVIAVDSGNVTNFWVAAGTETLFWTNTMIVADVNRPVEVQVSVTFGVGDIVTHWTFDKDWRFACKAPKVAELQGVSLVGKGELSSCWGDAQASGELVSFCLDGVPDEVVVTVTTTNGSELAMSDIGDYTYTRGGMLQLDFSLPDGWRFSDGREVWTEIIFDLQEMDGPYIPFLPKGLSELDYGPAGSWMTVAFDGSVKRFDDLDAALAAMKDNLALMACYSEAPREVSVAADGKSLTVNGERKPVRPHYHFVDFGGGMVAQFIDDGEADVFSVGEDPEDPTMMLLRSVEESVPDFSYSVIWADDVFFSADPGESEPRRGNGVRLELKAPKGDKGGRFYMIRVSDDF